ncbi:MAG: ABC transporter ATP-binding protein [Bacillota bacterium]
MGFEVNGISKCYGNVKANQNISFRLNEGEVLAVLGENGAGKTTLMRIIYGLEAADEGFVAIDGKRVRIDSPKDSIRLGIGMVHQHFMLVENFTVAENMILGTRRKKSELLDMKNVNERVKALFDEYRLPLDPKRIVGSLPVGLQQRVEIMKALYKGARILVLDEPTAVLTPMEIKELFHIVKQLTEAGKSVVFISHKLDEVMEVSDRVLVLRQGKVMGEVKTADTTKNELIRMMIGRELKALCKQEPPKSLERRVALDVKNLCVKGSRGKSIRDITFQLWNNEILGVAGVDGNGQNELVEAITGLRKIQSGQILVNGVKTAGLSVRRIRNLGLAHIPEDRRARGLILSQDLVSNYLLENHARPPFSKARVLRKKAGIEYAERLNREYQVVADSVFDKAETLSGGNQQKVVVAREIEQQPDVLVAVKPTRGVDVGAIEYIHGCILKEREKGKAILLVSSELEEIMALSDRILVMYNGGITGCVWACDVTREDLGAMMTGVKRDFTAIEPWREGA